MRIIRYPASIDAAAAELRRPAADDAPVAQSVAEILRRVQTEGDRALAEYTRQFDGFDPDRFEIGHDEMAAAASCVPDTLKAAIQSAASNIECFHRAEPIGDYRVATMQGVECWKKWTPVERVGLYVPAGSAPLFSTMLMLALPAKIAGCDQVIVCTPGGARGFVHPATLYAAQLCGVSRIFRVGGAQAIAAMTFGTESIPKVDKVFGPGNVYVTEAKLQAIKFGVGIDMPAGPSEVAVLADDSANPQFIAADILSQAEHGSDSQAVFVSSSEDVIERTLADLEVQISSLPRQAIARKALENSVAVLVKSLDDGVELLNRYAPEHLIIATDHPESIADRVRNAGSVFVGKYSCESAGDYASGTNHTLPTNGTARSYSGVSVLSFMRSITFQKISASGLIALGPVIEELADAEGLQGHKRAVSIRLEEIRK